MQNESPVERRRGAQVLQPHKSLFTLSDDTRDVNYILLAR